MWKLPGALQQGKICKLDQVTSGVCTGALLILMQSLNHIASCFIELLSLLVMGKDSFNPVV